MDRARVESFCQEFPFWKDLSDRERKKFCSPSSARHYDRRAVVDFEGLNPYENVFVVVQGHVNVMLANDDGQRVRFLRLQSGEWNLLYRGMELPAEICIESVAEKDAEIWYYPENIVKETFHAKEFAETYWIKSYERMMSEVLSLVSDLAFCPLKTRLVKYLETHVEEQTTNEICATHEMLADDLGTSREVISRLLKQLEDSGNIQLGRKKIILLRDSEEG